MAASPEQRWRRRPDARPDAGGRRTHRPVLRLADIENESCGRARAIGRPPNPTAHAQRGTPLSRNKGPATLELDWMMQSERATSVTGPPTPAPAERIPR